MHWETKNLCVSVYYDIQFIVVVWNQTHNILEIYAYKLSKVRDNENPESSKRKVTHYIQRDPHKSSSRFLSKNLVVQGRMG